MGPAVVPTDMDSRVVLIHALIPLGLQATHAWPPTDPAGTWEACVKWREGESEAVNPVREPDFCHAPREGSDTVFFSIPPMESVRALLNVRRRSQLPWRA